MSEAYHVIRTTGALTPSSEKSVLPTAVRVGLVGVGVATMTVLRLAAMPPPPPESDGFVTELRYGIVLWLGLVAVAISVVWRLVEALGRLLDRTVGEGSS